MENINYKQKIYAFFINCEYHLITKIGDNKYGVVPLFTDSYGIDEVESGTLEETLKLCKERNWKVKEFETYKDFFLWCLEEENSFDIMDFWGVKNLTGRHFYIEDNSDKITELRMDKDSEYNDFRKEISK